MKVFSMIMMVCCMVSAMTRSEQAGFYWVAMGLFSVARAICELC